MSTPRNLTYEMDAKERVEVKRVAKEHGLTHNSRGLLVALKEKLATESITRNNAISGQENSMDNLRDRLVKLASATFLEKEAKPAIGRLGERILGEKAVNPTMQAVKGALPFGSLWGGTKGHRLGHYAATTAGATIGSAIPVPGGSMAGGAIGAGMYGKHLAKDQQARLKSKLVDLVAVGGAGTAAVGGGAYALNKYRKKK